MYRQAIIVTVLLLIASAGNAQQVRIDSDGSLLSLGEFTKYTNQFNNVQITPGEFTTPDANFTVGGTLFFQQNRPTGLPLLQSSAAAGNSDAAVALGIAADRNGNSVMPSSGSPKRQQPVTRPACCSRAAPSFMASVRRRISKTALSRSSMLIRRATARRPGT